MKYQRFIGLPKTMTFPNTKASRVFYMHKPVRREEAFSLAMYVTMATWCC